MRRQVLIMTLVTGQNLIGKVFVDDSDENPYSRSGKTYILEDPLGIVYNKNPDVDASADKPFGVLDILALSATNEIKIHEDNVLYFYPPSSDIIHQYNQILLSKLEPIPDDEEEDDGEFSFIDKEE